MCPAAAQPRLVAAARLCPVTRLLTAAAHSPRPHSQGSGLARPAEPRTAPPCKYVACCCSAPASSLHPPRRPARNITARTIIRNVDWVQCRCGSLVWSEVAEPELYVASCYTRLCSAAVTTTHIPDIGHIHCRPHDTVEIICNLYSFYRQLSSLLQVTILYHSTNPSQKAF